MVLSTHRLGLAQVSNHARQEGRLADERRDVARRCRFEVRLRQVRRRGTVEVPVAVVVFALAVDEPDVPADLAAQAAAVVVKSRGRPLGPQRARNDVSRI